MQFDFGNNGTKIGPRQRQRQGPPPDYRSRAIRLRIFMATAVLFFVLIAMRQAKNPANWKWLWNAHAGSGNSSAGRSIDTRIVPPELDAAAELNSAVVAAEESLLQANVSIEREPVHDQDFGRLHYVAWQRVLGELSPNEFEDLGACLYWKRRQLSSAEKNVANNSTWEASFERIRSAWIRLIESQRTEHELEAEELSKYWQRIERELHTVSDADANGAAEEHGDLQTMLDEWAFARVRDDTVWRREERYAFYRAMEKCLIDNTDSTLARESAGEVTFAQLFVQSKEYRGKFVVVRGRARLAYWVTSPSNFLGVAGYYLVWIQPSGVENSPIALAVLELPDGFPTVGNSESSGKRVVLDEEIDVTGIALKRLAYGAEDGMRLAPLIVSRTFEWTPSNVAALELSYLKYLVVSLVGSLVVGIVIAMRTKVRRDETYPA